MLGDHLFSSNTNKSCVSQLVDVYEQNELLTIGLFELPIADVQSYGIAKIENADFKLSAIVEKPSQNLARSELAYDGKYYGVFMYVLTPEVYSVLSTEFAGFGDNDRELQLTPALDAVTKKYGAVGVLVGGTRYDIGMPEQYRRTVAEYGSNKS